MSYDSVIYGQRIVKTIRDNPESPNQTCYVYLHTWGSSYICYTLLRRIGLIGCCECLKLLWVAHQLFPFLPRNGCERVVGR